MSTTENKSTSAPLNDSSGTDSSGTGSLVTSVTSASSPVTLTEKAATRVVDHMTRKENVEGLRFGVRKNGCSGLAYIVDFADAIGDDDQVFESHGVKIIIDAKSVIAVAGTEIDYGPSDDGLSETFQFRNPNVTGSCGCGESFSVS